jgi:spermidine/putrescine transport system permease protein
MSPREQSRPAMTRALLLAAPGAVWLGVFLAVPMALILAISFFSVGDYGEIQKPLTPEHYSRFIGFGTFGWEPLYPVILLRSLTVSAIATVLCLIVALPLAFTLAALGPRWKSTGLVLVTVPLWTNLLIRTYAWQMLLSDGGWLATAWSWIGGSPVALYPGTVAVYLAVVCDYLPFLVLPIYASVEKIDWNLVEAAQDLGAARWHSIRHGIWPQIRPGVMAGIVLVFVPAVSQFIIPDLLGGGKTVLLGNVVQQQFGQSQNWPFGSAVATVAMIVVLGGMCLYLRATRKPEESA